LGRLTHFESHFDRFRPEVRDRWRESKTPGGGLWYDLGPHLLDQVLQLFGPPDTLQLDLAVQPDKAQADDWFHALLRYGNMRVILHASTLSAHLGPRFILHGTEASYCKWGMDPQEEALRAGARPLRVEPNGPLHWGVDTQPGVLRRATDKGSNDATIQGPPGDYTAYYAQLRDALRGQRPNPVPPEQALQVMELIELGLHSWQQGRVMAL
jgi:predicted dehydrogenase